MTDDVKAAGERLRLAIDGKTGRPKRAFAEVAAVDVVAVGETIAAEAHTEVTRDLVRGAAGALGNRADPDGELKVHQYADQVKQLLDLAGVP